MTVGVVQLQTTLPDEPSARRLAETLVVDRLAACVQVVGPVQSLFRWDGKIESATEWLCLIKTTAATTRALQDRIRSLHPYTTPEIIVLPVVGGDAGYLGWVRKEVEGESEKGGRG